MMKWRKKNMEIKFTNGINIVIKEDDLLRWEQKDKVIKLIMKDKRVFEADLKNGIFKGVK